MSVIRSYQQKMVRDRTSRATKIKTKQNNIV